MKLITAAHRNAIIDWLAVDQVSEQGQRLPLREPERAEVIRRLYGHIADNQLAQQLYITSRVVIRIAARLGLTTNPAAGSDPGLADDQNRSATTSLAA